MDIHLRLSNDSCKRTFSHESTKESNQRFLYFKDACIIYGSLRVGDKGEVRSGVVHICEGNPSEDQFATFAYVEEFAHDGKTYPTCFEAKVHIPSDTFSYLLNLNDDQAIIHLTLGFDNDGSNIKWEPNGDDGEMYWDVSEKTNTYCIFEIANKVTIGTFKEKEAI